MPRRAGWSVRLKLTLSYASFLMIAGGLLLAVVWVFLLRYVPQRAFASDGPFFPGRDDLIRAFLPAALSALAFLLVLGLAGGWFLAGRMLAPLTQIAAATRTAATGSLSHRIRMDGSQDEFRELADSFDGMLARLEAQVSQQQRFAANASHELRTPLAVTQTLLDVARMDPGHDHAELLQRLRVVNARTIDLTEALLALSRADQRSFERERVDLSLMAEEAAEVLLPIAERQGVRIDVDGDAAFVLGSAALLQQLATNLLHNAIVHNLPAEGSVLVRTAAAEGHVTLLVESTGEVLDPQLIPTLTEPFRRGASRVRSDHAGVGLGLAIVESIVQAHEGTLALSARRAGGLRVDVRLPAAPRSVEAG
ncbi:HAMP domain-containing sensor histidine kinase [Agrococcus sp. ARC_14]|uniref:sensor histidine kinase n=1 Tax=Agrococcus sp. ARC_14 TaxID=2919927 RepID=UPI001F0543C9|nr:HAMP domain-containing sensor histidine kinase [Agrococcus sp. ARC_14]MCH1884406.1 HAMP domain-containing histidine kinase [Agrococcus sp. ARC_14]